MKHYLLLALVSSLALSGCATQEDDDLEGFLKNPGAPPAKVEKVPVAKIFPSIEYNRKIVRDPFKPEQESMANPVMENPYANQPKYPLESFPLEALTMTGLLTQNGQSYALIRDTEAQIHRVPVGSRIGQNYGRIVSVTRRGIQIMESVQDASGQWVEVENALPYKESEKVSAK